jgi:hypothetical protein
VIQELQPVKDAIKFKLLADDYRGMYEVISAMGELTASAQLRSSGFQGSGNMDDLVAFGKDESWQEPLISYAQAYALKVKKDHRAFLKLRKDQKL